MSKRQMTRRVAGILSITKLSSQEGRRSGLGEVRLTSIITGDSTTREGDHSYNSCGGWTKKSPAGWCCNTRGGEQVRFSDTS